MEQHFTVPGLNKCSMENVQPFAACLTVNETTSNIALVQCNGFISEASSFSLQLRVTEACSRVRYVLSTVFQNKYISSDRVKLRGERGE